MLPLLNLLEASLWERSTSSLYVEATVASPYSLSGCHLMLMAFIYHPWRSQWSPRRTYHTLSYLSLSLEATLATKETLPYFIAFAISALSFSHYHSQRQSPKLVSTFHSETFHLSAAILRERSCSSSSLEETVSPKETLPYFIAFAISALCFFAFSLNIFLYSFARTAFWPSVRCLLFSATEIRHLPRIIQGNQKNHNFFI